MVNHKRPGHLRREFCVKVLLGVRSRLGKWLPCSIRHSHIMYIIMHVEYTYIYIYIYTYYIFTYIHIYIYIL